MTTFRHDDDFIDRVPVEVLNAKMSGGIFVVEAAEKLSSGDLVVVDAGGRVVRCWPGGAPVGVTMHSAPAGGRVHVLIDESKIGRLA